MLQVTNLNNKSVAVIGELIPTLEKTDLVSLCDASSIFFFGKKKAKESFENSFNKIETYNKPNVFHFLISEKKKDTYAWQLFKLLNDKKDLKFDFVIYKGNHSFDIDGAAMPLIVRSLKAGGIIAIADSEWSIAKSPTMNPKANPNIKKEYTDDQIQTCPIKELISFYFKNEFIEIKINKPNLRVFKKL